MTFQSWSIARLMTGVAILALGMAALLALCPRAALDDPSLGVLAFALALILTIESDQVLFGRRYRAFWIGSLATSWLVAAFALSFLQDTRSHLLTYGPPLIRARGEFRQELAAVQRARSIGIELATPEVSEWYLLGSMMTEAGLGITVGLLTAAAGGLLAASVALILRKARPAARRLHPPRNSHPL